MRRMRKLGSKDLRSKLEDLRSKDRGVESTVNLGNDDEYL